jgi:hypothetical protein
MYPFARTHNRLCTKIIFYCSHYNSTSNQHYYSKSACCSLSFHCFLMLFQVNCSCKHEWNAQIIVSKSFIKKTYCTVPVCICPECTLISAHIQVQNNSVRTSKKNICVCVCIYIHIHTYILLSLITFNAHQVPVSAFFCTMCCFIKVFYTIHNTLCN